jgi:predicted transcriptional regulator of viral defense system
MNSPTSGVRPGDPTIGNWLQLVRAEYLEMPGLRLTKRQVERLWGLDPVMCEALLSALVEGGFLRCTRQGTYVRFES